MASRKARSTKRKRQARQHRHNFGPRSAPAAPITECYDDGLFGLKPSPFPGECREDLAVFTKEIREQLPAEWRAEAEAVGESLDLLADGRDDAAQECLKRIARKSPYADWRLLVRGVIAFYQQNLEIARENWARLDPARRPARIAAVLLQGVTGTAVNAESGPPPADLVPRVHYFFVQREALRAARNIVQVRHHDGETKFSASQVAMLKEFCLKYRRTEQRFVQSFGEACIRLACYQPHDEIFQLLKSVVSGPPADPRWNLLGVSYYKCFAGAEQPTTHCINSYLRTDLQRLADTPEPVREALASSLCELLADEALNRSSVHPFPFNLMAPPPDYRRAEKALREAIERYPQNRQAHHKLIDMLDRQLERERLSKSAEEQLEEQLVAAREQLVRQFPDEVETTLTLIDHYFKEDQLERVQALVRQLSDQRLDDPLVRALPWKLKLREAMRLSRRKKEVEAARQALNEAESIWPSWLNRQWLPYLRAALELRAGNRAAFEQWDGQARRDGGQPACTADVMCFAALQQMNLPSTQLKPFREAVEQHIRQVSRLSQQDLIELGAFFWDQVRTGLRHKGYRRQASQFGKALCGQLGRCPPLAENPPPALLDACSWLASHGFWLTPHTCQAPRWMTKLAAHHPKATAALLDWLFQQRVWPGWWITGHADLVTRLQVGARTESDPYYRHRYDRIATQAAAEVAQMQSYSAHHPYGWEDMLDDEDDEDFEEEYFDEDDDEDDNGQNGKYDRYDTDFDKVPFFTRPTQSRDESEDDEYEADEYEYDFGIPPPDSMMPILAKVVSHLGPNAVDLLDEAMLGDEDRGPAEEPEEKFRRICELFVRHGLSTEDAAEFLMQSVDAAAQLDMTDPVDEFGDAPDPAAPAPREMSPEEKEAWRKQRHKILAQKKKQKKRR